MEKLYRIGSYGWMAIIITGVLFLGWACYQRIAFKAKKIWIRKLSLQGLEYTLSELYELLEKNLQYPHLRMLEFEQENQRIKILCKNSVQILNLENGELILRGETKGAFVEELIDTECVMIAIEECLEFPVEESSKYSLQARQFGKWAIFAVVPCMAFAVWVIPHIRVGFLTKSVQETCFSQYSSTVTIGEALERRCVDTKWEEGTYGENKGVRFSGYLKDTGAPVSIIFEVNKDTVQVVEVGFADESYNDNFSIHFLLTAIYNYTSGGSISNDTGNDGSQTNFEPEITSSVDIAENDFYGNDNNGTTYNDYDWELESMEENTDESAVYDYLGTLHSIYDDRECLNLYLDDDWNLCVWNGIEGENEAYYAQAYDTYTIEGNTLYGFAEDFVDEFVFQEEEAVKGQVEVLLSGTGSEHYQTYVQEGYSSY